MSEPRTTTERMPGFPPAPVSDAEAPQLGSLLLGRYRVHECREGGFAFVACVRDEEDAQWLAIKIPKQPAGSTAEFEAEASFWLTLERHPNIVRAFGVREILGKPSLFLEFVGGHIFNTVRAMFKRDRPLARDQALDFIRQVCVAMEFANRKGEVAHLDLKPENLMVAAGGVLKVTDFGLARRVQVVDGKYPLISNGTWPYVAPEIFEGKPADSRADIYACGVILHELLTGATPFGLDRDAELYPQMKGFHESGKLSELTKTLYYHDQPGPRERSVREILSHCLQWYPGERPSFPELRERIEAIMRTSDAGVHEAGLSPAEEFERAASLCRLGRVDEALTLFNSLMVREPRDHALWLRIAEILDAVGQTRTADDIRGRL